MQEDDHANEIRKKYEVSHLACPRPRLRWINDVEDDLRKLGVKQWRTKALEREEWALIIKEAKAKLKGPQCYRKKKMQQLITGLLFVVQIPLNMFRASLRPSSGAYQLQQQPLVYRRNVRVAVLLAVVGQQHCYHHVPTVNRRLLLQLIGS